MTQLFVKQLTVLDFSYLDYQRGLVGESWIVDVFLDGHLDQEGMIQDFGLVKRRLKTCIEEVMDHKLVIPGQCPTVKLKDDHNQVEFYDQHQHYYRQICPAQALYRLDHTEVSMAAAVTALEQAARQAVPDSVHTIKIQLRTEKIPGAYYHYSHGLKKHQGNCQRIAHGHRSKIEIFVDQQSRADLEIAWAQQWADIYLGTHEDIASQPKIQNLPYYEFAYEAQQGRYELILPQSRCYLMDTDTTVEHISAHIATQLHQQEKKPVQVWAYEGVDKGSIYTTSTQIGQ